MNKFFIKFWKISLCFSDFKQQTQFSNTELHKKNGFLFIIYELTSNMSFTDRHENFGCFKNHTFKNTQKKENQPYHFKILK